MTFYENLQRICKTNGISVTALCKNIGLSNATATKWKHGAHPNNGTLLKISEYFKISINELIEENTEEKEAISIFKDNVVHLCKAHGITLDELAFILKISEEELEYIRIDESERLSERTIIIIANYFKISRRTLMYGTLPYTKSEINERNNIIKAYYKAPEYIKKAVRKLLDAENQKDEPTEDKKD